MQSSIQPEYHVLKVTCSCGNSFETGSTLSGGTLAVEVCAECHPFYTGKQKLAADGGRAKRFLDRYKRDK